MFNAKKSKNFKRADERFLINNFNNFTLTEAYNSARTNLIFSLATKKRRTVVFTSGAPGEGKSTTSVNMAITIAKTGAKVLLIDADLRKPSIQTMLFIKNKDGFSTLIGKFCTVEQSINIDVVENLDVICSGPIPPNPAELLSSPFVGELLAFFQKKYDFIIIDTPPIGIVSDALLMNNLVSGLIYVVRENSTTHNELKEALNAIKLANGNVLGIIKVDSKEDKFFKNKSKARGTGKYNYNYGYRYNYGTTVKKDSNKPKKDELKNIDDNEK